MSNSYVFVGAGKDEAASPFTYRTLSPFIPDALDRQASPRDLVFLLPRDLPKLCHVTKRYGCFFAVVIKIVSLCTRRCLVH
mmetsp:Transcript_97623/g.198297  ORF Transcript_97623/g.198297 Transcript_97623/m.198297 type:complete len:81 (-) Transcript_97623:175-417(-)